MASGGPQRSCPRRHCQASAATFALCLFSERRLGRRGFCRLRLSSVGRLVPVSLFVRETRLSAESRPAFVVRLGALLRRFVTTGFVVTGAAISRLGFAPGRVRPLFRRCLTL